MNNHLAVVVSISVLILSLGCTQGSYTADENIAATTPEEYATTTVHSTATTLEPSIDFRFYENNTNCPLDGNVTFGDFYAGRSVKGLLNFKISDFLTMKKSNGTEVCIDGFLENCTPGFEKWHAGSCWIAWIELDHFSSSPQEVSFSHGVNLHKPASYAEMTNFITPLSMENFISHQRDIGFFTNDTLEDMENLNSYVDSHFSYRYDSDTSKSGSEYWKMPNETLATAWGDCEERSTLFVSLEKAYNSSLKCYVLYIPSHAGAFCKFEYSGSTVYGFYDQNTRLKAFVYSNDGGTAKINSVMNSYFTQFGLEEQNQKILAAFDDHGYATFANNDEFVQWALKI